MTYQPDLETHRPLKNISSCLWCVTCSVTCADDGPCDCCQSQPSVRYVSSGDTGVSGEK